MNVELLTLEQSSPVTGIGRYTQSLLTHLSPRINIQVRLMSTVRLARRFSFLCHLPTGVMDHRAGSIVHFPQIMGCALMLWRPQHPCIATVHDLGPLELPEEMRMLDPLARQILRLSLAGLKRADKIVTVSEFTRQSVINHLKLSPDQVVTVHHAIDHNVFKPHSNARVQLIQRYPALGEKTGPWVLYVGTELPRKNLKTLLSAVAELKQRYSRLVLLKIGFSGGERFRAQTRRDIQLLELENSVLFFEGISDECLALFYAACSVCALPSRLEGFSFPVLESLACGAPVVCSDAASYPEISGDATVLVDPDNVQNWVEAITYFLEHFEHRDVYELRGLTRAAAFTWDKAANQMMEVYQSFS